MDAISRVLVTRLLAIHRRGATGLVKRAGRARRLVEEDLQLVLAGARHDGDMTPRAADDQALLVEYEMLERHLLLLAPLRGHGGGDQLDALAGRLLDVVVRAVVGIRHHDLGLDPAGPDV